MCLRVYFSGGGFVTVHLTQVFGPVLPVLTFKTLDEAFELACDTKFGLTSSIYTTNVDVAERAKNELRFGETYVNRENFEAIQGFHAGGHAPVRRRRRRRQARPRRVPRDPRRLRPPQPQGRRLTRRPGRGGGGGRKGPRGGRAPTASRRRRTTAGPGRRRRGAVGLRQDPVTDPRRSVALELDSPILIAETAQPSAGRGRPWGPGRRRAKAGSSGRGPAFGARSRGSRSLQKVIWLRLSSCAAAPAARAAPMPRAFRPKTRASLCAAREASRCRSYLPRSHRRPHAHQLGPWQSTTPARTHTNQRHRRYHAQTCRSCCQLKRRPSPPRGHGDGWSVCRRLSPAFPATVRLSPPFVFYTAILFLRRR